MEEAFTSNRYKRRETFMKNLEVDAAEALLDRIGLNILPFLDRGVGWSNVITNVSSFLF